MAFTAKNLAKELGVSPSAVSLALNGRSGISAETRQRILDAAARHGLYQNGKRRQENDKISLVIYRDHGMVFGDTPFFANVMEGIGGEAAEQGCRFQVLYVQKQRDIREQLKTAGLEDSTGVILLATELLEQDIAPFQELSIPLVLFDSAFLDEKLSCVAIDNIQGTCLATQHLLEMGHRRLGYLHSSVDIHNFRERKLGILAAVHDPRKPYRAEITPVSVGSTTETAYRDMSRYLDTLDGQPLPVTAYIADNDIIAVACMQALREHGYRIPADVSIVGFDNFPVAATTQPPLTTVHVDQQLLGRSAVRMLLWHLREQPEASARWVFRLKTSLVKRDSVRRLSPEEA